MPGDHQEVQRVGGQEDDEHRDRVAALLGVRRVDRVQRDAAEQRERRVREQVVEQVGPAHAPAQRVDQRRGEAEERGRRRAEQRHRQHEAGERAADPEALGVEHEDVRAEHQQREQADERRAAPTGSRRTGRSRTPSTTTSAIACADRHRAPAAGERHAAERQALSGSGVGAGASAPAAASHHGERPDDQPQPDDKCDPDDHSEQLNAYPCSSAIRPRPEFVEYDDSEASMHSSFGVGVRCRVAGIRPAQRGSARRSNANDRQGGHHGLAELVRSRVPARRGSRGRRAGSTGALAPVFRTSVP